MTDLPRQTAGTVMINPAVALSEAQSEAAYLRNRVLILRQTLEEERQRSAQLEEEIAALRERAEPARADAPESTETDPPAPRRARTN